MRSTALLQLRDRLHANTALTDDDRNVVARGLLGLIESLQQKISAADDAIDFGFLRAQSDIYRLRQLMLGNQLGTKLATSPALATIAKGDTATTVRADLSALYTTLKKEPPPSTPTPATTAPSTGGGTTPILFTRALTFQPTSSELRVAAAASFVAPPASSGITLGPADIVTSKPVNVELPARTFEGSTTSTVLRVGGGVSLPTTSARSSAVVGAAEFRNVTVAERIEPPPAGEARQFAVASRHDALQTIDKLDGLKMKVDDLAVYSVPSSGGTRIDTTFGAIKSGAGGIGAVLSDPPPNATEEASFFHDTVLLVEAHVGTLRGLEGRVAQYRAVLQDCQATLAAVQASMTSLDTRLAVVEQQVDDARHAVATARSLLAEETARVDQVNTSRAAILATYVDLLAYVRPRFFECVTDVPELAMNPALLESPVPACLGGHDDAPPEVAEMIALLREAPLAWFQLGPPILKLLDRVELLHGLMVTARSRAVAVADTGLQTSFVASSSPGGSGRQSARSAAPRSTRSGSRARRSRASMSASSRA